ncbi:MAG: alpha/beta fold hydrolase, partial [Bdellovibrionia bacterium]
MKLSIKSTDQDISIHNQYLFIHGGPGLNSFAEKTILGSLFSDRNVSITFWNEPSKFRPTVLLDSTDSEKTPKAAFSRLLESAEKTLVELAQSGPVKLIGHSFGCNTATILAARNPNLVAELNLIAPAFDQLEAHRNIMRIAIEDFKLSSP